MSAKNFWVRINPKKINSVISSEYLDILEPLLDTPSTETPLKDDTFAKSQIYKLIVMSKLQINSFRKEIFSYFRDEELIELSKLLSLPTSNREFMIKELLSIPWNKNSKAKLIASYIDVPEFILNISSQEDIILSDQVIPWILKYDYFLKTKEFDKLESEFLNRSPFKTLKDYQTKSQCDVLDILDTRFERCLLNMPTGTGKTRTAMEIVCSFLINKPSQSIVWIADTQELLDQAAIEFKQLWEFLGDRKIKTIKRYGNKKEGFVKESSIIITSFQTLIREVVKYSDLDISLVVIDEAHKCIAKEWNKNLSKLVNLSSGTRLLGLTATPVRSYDLESKKLIEFFNNNLVQIENKSGKNIFQYLIERGILSRPIYEKIKTNITYKLEKKIMEDIKRKGLDIPKELLTKLAKDFDRNLAITKKLKEILGEPSDKRQILFFASTVEHSRMIATWLVKNGYSSFHLDSSTDNLSRKTCIEAFRQGKIRVICNYGVLSTGFDVPLIDCVFIARPTTSHVLHSQMIGRGLRGPKIGGTTNCLIIEVEDNIEKFSKDYLVSFEKYRQSWENYDKDNFSGE